MDWPALSCCCPCLLQVRAFLRQLLHSVVYMHELSLIHTDLKPENVLFLDQDLVSVTHPPGSKCVTEPEISNCGKQRHCHTTLLLFRCTQTTCSFSFPLCRFAFTHSPLYPPLGSPSCRLARKLPRRAAVRLIDFGSATFDEDYHSTIVCTRHYRAPEIILGLGWSHPCDMWSLGCILVELVTGDALFQTHENLEHLALMEAVVGPMPEQLAQAGAGGSATALFVVAGTACGNVARLNWPLGAESKKSVRAVAKMRPLREHLAANTDGSVAPYLDTITGEYTYFIVSFCPDTTLFLLWIGLFLCGFTRAAYPSSNAFALIIDNHDHVLSMCLRCIAFP